MFMMVMMMMYPSHRASLQTQNSVAKRLCRANMQRSNFVVGTERVMTRGLRGHPPRFDD